MILGLALFFCTAVLLCAETSVEIDLQEQRAYLLQNGRPVLASPISSGRYGHLTKTGSFTVLEKERSHYSSMKSFGCKLSRHFVANAFVRSGNQRRFHVRP